MKKVIYLFAIIATTLAFTACSSDDDDDDVPKQDQIIGKWKLIEEYKGDTKLDVGCDGLSIFEVKGDGTFTSENHEDIGDGKGCTLRGTAVGTWVNEGNNLYKFTYGKDDEDKNTITFTKDTFSFIDDYEDVDYKYVYKRQ